MPTLQTSDITSIIDYIQSTESFLSTTITTKLGEQQCFDFATGLIPVGSIPEDDEDLTLLNGHLTDLNNAIAILKAARDGGDTTGGDCSSIATALNNLSGTLNFTGLMNQINAALNAVQNTLLTAITAVNTIVTAIQTTVNSIKTTVTTINTNVSTINTNLNSAITTINTINTNVSAIQTTVGTINTRTLTTNTNVSTILSSTNTMLAWNNTGGILQLINTCCSNLNTNLNTSTLSTKLDTILTWNNSGGVLVGINSTVNNILTWNNSGNILPNIYSDTENIKTTVNSLSSSGGSNTDITTIKNCCSALTTTVGNQLSLSNTINTTLNNWVSSGGILQTLSSCCSDVDTKVTSLGSPVDLTGINNKLDSILNQFPSLSGTLLSEKCDTANNSINYSGSGFTGVSSLILAINNQLNQQHVELCNKFGSINFNVSGSFPGTTCNSDGSTISTTVPFSDLSSAISALGGQLNNTHKDVCKSVAPICTVLYPSEQFAEFNYESQLTIWFKDSDGSRWQYKIPAPINLTDSDWCTKINPISIAKGSVYGRINYAGSKVASSGYFATQDEAIRVLNLFAGLSTATASAPRITFNPTPKRIPKETIIFPDSAIIATLSDGKITGTKCLRPPVGGC